MLNAISASGDCCINHVRFSFFSAMPRDGWKERFQNDLSLCRVGHKTSTQSVTCSHQCRLVVLIYGTVAREINFILFTPRLALSSIAKIFPATIPYCSTDCELVILISLTHTY